MFTIRRTIACLVALAVVLAGCTRHVGPPDPSPTPTVSPYDLPAPALWSNDAQPIGSPSVGETEIVSYIRTATGMAMASYDLATGKELWRDEADPGDSNNGWEPSAPLIERDGRSWTAYLGPHDREVVRLKVVDARTGRPVPLSTDLIWATSLPKTCRTPTTTFCLTGNRTRDESLWRQPGQVNPVTGQVSLGGPLEVPVEGAGLRGDHVYTLYRGGAGPDEVGYVVDGGVRWKRPYTDVFGPTAMTMDGSWWLDSSDRTVIVGSWFDAESGYRAADAMGSAVVDLASTGSVVGLDPVTGGTLWSLAGASICRTFGRIPYPPAATVVPVCRFTRGTMIITKGTSTGQVTTAYSDDLAYELTGVDLVTGRVLWTVPMHNDVYRQYAHAGPYLLSASSETTLVALSGTRQWQLVDRATGAVTAPGSTTVIACLAQRPWLVVKGHTPHFYTGTAGYACHADGTASATWSVGAARDAGTSGRDGSVRVVSSDKGFLAVRVRG